MNIPFVDLAAQYKNIQREIDRAIAGVIADTAFIGGKRVQQFEREFADYLGVECCVGCANGTDAIEILLQSLGVGKGDEVLVPAHSWFSTSEAVTAIGARPIFIDTHPAFYTLNPELLESHITERTKAIIPVHLYGLPAPMDQILAFAQKHRLFVLEDCAQAHGALYQGRKIGTFGDAASFSFYPGKNLGAYGDAGAMVAKDPEVVQRARMIANHGQLKKHDHQMEGRNSRLDGLQAAILSTKLPYLESWNEARRSHAARYSSLLRNEAIQLPVESAGSRHVYHLFVVQVPDRARVQTALKAAGIETAIHYPSILPLLPAYHSCGYAERDFPVSSAYAARILSLPMFAELTDAMIEAVAESLLSAVNQRSS